MNIGYFTSFTAFLALNDADFCNNYLRSKSSPEGILPLAGYLTFWGWFFALATVLIAAFKHETNFQPAGKVTASQEDCSNACRKFHTLSSLFNNVSHVCALLFARLNVCDLRPHAKSSFVYLQFELVAITMSQSGIKFRAFVVLYTVFKRPF